MSNEIVTAPNVGEARPTSGTDGSRPSGFAGAIFDRLQKAVPAVLPTPEEKPTEVITPVETKSTELAKTDEAKTAEVLADAGKAEEKVEKPVVAEKEAAKKQTSESIRALIKASNLPAEHKDEIVNLAYQGKAAQESGMTLDAVRAFKENGITPASVLERIKLHPTFDDAKKDAWYAGEMRRIATDYNKDPKKFLLGLKQSAGSTQVFPNLVAAIAEFLPTEAPRVVTSIKTDGIKTALLNLGREALAQANEDRQTAVKMVQEAFGFSSELTAQTPTKDPRLAELEKKNAEFESRQKAQDEQSRNQFLQSVVTEARNTVYKEIERRWAEAAPAGLDVDETKRAIDDIYKGVETDLAGVSNFVYDLESRRNGPLTEQAYRDSVKYAFDRASPFIPTHQKSALDFWSKRALATAQIRETTNQKAAKQVDAAEVGGAAPATTTPSARDNLKAIRAKGGLDFRDTLMAAMAGVGRK